MNFWIPVVNHPELVVLKEDCLNVFLNLITKPWNVCWSLVVWNLSSTRTVYIWGSNSTYSEFLKIENFKQENLNMVDKEQFLVFVIAVTSSFIHAFESLIVKQISSLTAIEMAFTRMVVQTIILVPICQYR